MNSQSPDAPAGSSTDINTDAIEDETPPSVPIEFTAEFVAEHSPEDAQLYTAFLRSGEPYRSLGRKEFHRSARDGYYADPDKIGANGPTPGIDITDDDVYYNTAGAASEYWRDVALPQPTKDIQQLRSDLRDWGYCLISEALSDRQCRAMRQRLAEQAAAERRAGIASWMGTAAIPGQAQPNVQFLHSLINKGEQFIQCVEHDPAGVQAGPVIEQLIIETIGEGFLMSSFIGIISNQYNMPQGLHQDQATAPFQDATAPYTCNTMFIMDDMGEHNGGTLVVPGSHQLLSAAGSGQPITEPLPPAINLTAPAGTVMMFEGRLLHGTGVNKSNAPRTILVMNSIKPFMRQQELHMMSAATDVLRNASSKLLYRLGARPSGLGGIEGAWNGDFLVNQRLRLERGEYQPVRALHPDMSDAELGAAFTYRESYVGRRQAPDQPEVLDAVKAHVADQEPIWHKPQKAP